MLGALSLVLLFGLAREIGGRRLAWVALLVRVAFPGGELERTLLGFGDHHAAEIFLGTAVLWAWVWWWKRFGVEDSWKGNVSGIAASIPLVVFLFTWIGAPLWVAFVSLAFWSAWLSSVWRGEASGREVFRFLPFFSAIPALAGMTAIVWPEGVMVPEILRITLVALALQVILILGMGAGLPIVIERRGCRFAVLAIAGSALLALLFVIVAHPATLRLTKTFLSPANAGIAEHVSFPFSRIWADYGLLAPWVVYGLIAGARRVNPWPLRVVFWGIGFWGLLAFWRSDFFYLTGALFPLAAATGMWSFIDLAQGWRRGKRGSDSWRWVPWISVLVSLGVLWPLGRLRPPLIERDEIKTMVVATKPWRETMSWLREKTAVPPVSPTFLAPSWRKRDGFTYPPGTDAVFTHWQFGNLVCTLGERIAVSARSRSSEFIDWFLVPEEPVSLQRLERLGEVRYLVLDAVSVCDTFATEAIQAGIPVESIQVSDGVKWQGITLKSYGEPFRRAIGANLYLGDGVSMERYRLVHESEEKSFVRYRLLPEEDLVVLRSDLVEASDLETLSSLANSGAAWREEGGYLAYSGQILPSVKIFELVEGALLEGSLSPGERVSLELPLLVTNSGREFRYRRDVVAGDDGRVRIRVPYATETGNGKGVRALTPYRIRGEGGREGEVGVTENQVREGSTVSF